MKLKIEKTLRKLFMICILCSTIITQGVYAAAAPAPEPPGFPISTNELKEWPQGPEVTEETGVLMDAASGTILYNKGMDEKRYPASITKIMTALLALENSKPTDNVTFTATGVKDAYSGSSNIGMQVGEVLTMEQCLYMVMLKSANEVTTQVAEYVGGTLEDFIAMMNAKAVELGCTNTHFNNANGLPDENHYTTAHDMALIAREAIKNETFCKIIATQNYKLPPTNMNSKARSYDNHHAMIFEGDWFYEGCMGGKTGYTDAARSTLVTYAKRDGLLLVSVLMKGDGTQIVRDTKTLLDYGYDSFESIELPIVGEATGVKTGVIPKGKKVADLKAAEEIQGDLVKESWFYQDYLIGTATVTKASYEQIQEKGKNKTELNKKKSQDSVPQGKVIVEKESNNSMLHIAILVLAGAVVLSLLVLIIKLISNKKHKKYKKHKK